MAHGRQDQDLKDTEELLCETHMFPNHIDALRFQELEIILHGLPIRGRHDSIWPPTLVEGTELEDEFAVEKWPRNALDLAY